MEPLVTGVARKKLESVSRARVVGDVNTGKRRTRTRPGVDEAIRNFSQVPDPFFDRRPKRRSETIWSAHEVAGYIAVGEVSLHSPPFWLFGSDQA